MVKVCAHYNCPSTTFHSEKPHMKDVSFFMFPHPHRETDRCKRWIISTRRADLSLNKITKNHYVCSIHFENLDPNDKDVVPNPASESPEMHQKERVHGKYKSGPNNSKHEKKEKKKKSALQIGINNSQNEKRTTKRKSALQIGINNSQNEKRATKRKSSLQIGINNTQNEKKAKKRKSSLQIGINNSQNEKKKKKSPPKPKSQSKSPQNTINNRQDEVVSSDDLTDIFETNMSPIAPIEVEDIIDHEIKIELDVNDFNINQNEENGIVIRLDSPHENHTEKTLTLDMLYHDLFGLKDWAICLKDDELQFHILCEHSAKSIKAVFIDISFQTQIKVLNRSLPAAHSLWKQVPNCIKNSADLINILNLLKSWPMCNGINNEALVQEFRNLINRTEIKDNISKTKSIHNDKCELLLLQSSMQIKCDTCIELEMTLHNSIMKQQTNKSINDTNAIDGNN